MARLSDDLAGYQDAAYALRFTVEVERVAAIERERVGDRAGAVAGAYAGGLHKLMAYKDEYEVARLHLDGVERAKLESEFGPGATVQVMLHPPVLRSLGMNRKVRLGRSAGPLFGALRALRGVRGTALDPFGRSEVRRLERALVGEYRELVAAALERLDPERQGLVVRIAQLPDMVRGYEQIKLENVARMRAEAERLTEQLQHAEASAAPPQLVVVQA